MLTTLSEVGLGAKQLALGVGSELDFLLPSAGCGGRARASGDGGGGSGEGDREAAAATMVVRGTSAAWMSSTERLDARATSSETLCLISEATSAFMSTS